MKSFPESGRTQLYARDLATGKPGDVYPLRCVPGSDLLVAAGCEAEGRGGRLAVPGEGPPHTPSATVGSVGRHLAGSLAWTVTLAAAHCPSAPLLTAPTAVGSSRCSCPDASPGRDRDVFSVSINGGQGPGEGWGQLRTAQSPGLWLLLNSTSCIGVPNSGTRGQCSPNTG